MSTTPEPTRLGAVVQEPGGMQWVRVGTTIPFPWRPADASHAAVNRAWDELNEPREVDPS